MTTKSDAPALRMIVERGPKLAPATAFDAERLDSYAIGRTLRLTPVEEADRKDIRRWWAILNRAVRDTKTPWRTATQASEAIKLALGIVEYGKTVGGKFMQWPRSLKELDDQELAQAVRDMGALLHKMTGVDPLEWSKETADVGSDEHPQSGAPQHAQPDSGSGVPQAAAPYQPESASPPGERIQPGGDEAMETSSATVDRAVDDVSHQSAAADLAAGGDDTSDQNEDAPPAINLTDDDRAYLVDVYRRMSAAVGEDVRVLRRSTAIFAKTIETRSTLVKAKASAIRRELEKCCGEKPESSLGEVRKYVASLIGVDDKELVN